MKYIAAAFLLAGVSVAQASQPVSYSLGGQSFEGQWTEAPQSKGLVLVVPDWDGIDRHEIGTAEKLAALGYSSFILDMFGQGAVLETVDDRKAATGALYKDRGEMRRRVMAGLTAAQTLGGDLTNAIAIGYCFGGSTVLELARSGADLKGYVSFHGGLSTPDGQSYSSVKAPILIAHGGADKVVPIEDVADIVSRLEADNASYELNIYSGADHAFTVAGASRYSATAANASWANLETFLDDNLAGK